MLLALMLLTGNYCHAQDPLKIILKLKDRSVSLPMYKYNSFGDVYNEGKNRTTFFAGAGTFMSFHTGSNGRNEISICGILGVNFKLSNKFYLNLNTFYIDNHGHTLLSLFLAPEYRFAFQNMELFLGCGGILGYGSGGLGASFIITSKFNYFLNDNFGVGFEVNYPTIFAFYDDIIINVNAGIVFRF